MHSLFWKIFLGFWFCILLIGGVLVLIAVNTDHRRAALGRQGPLLEHAGMELSRVYSVQGEAPVIRRTRKLSRQLQLSLFFYTPQGDLLGPRPAPPYLNQLATLAADSGEIERRPARHGSWYALPLANGTVVLAKLPPPNFHERFFDPHRLGTRLLVTFVIAGLICWWLARSLTAPLKRLRRATRQLAAGDLSARVGPLGKRQDEAAELARDFDRMAEQIEQLLGSQRQMLGDISHELRSPLARMAVALELARQQAGTEVHPSLARIEQESERLNQLIGEILALTRAEQDLAGVPNEDIDLNNLLQRVADNTRYEAQAKQVGLNCDITPPVLIHGQPELLLRGLENILRNALHYSPANGTIDLQLTTLDQRAQISIADQGPGVPPGDLAHLFEPFYRVASARDRQSGGTGLGLTIAAHAVTRHGGEISASNMPSSGLKISITLPLNRPN